ncbi:hypothetical protein HG535_0G03520 [Zygotorulaspora mrakii]|uniref:DNA primase large subunit n=1 Tax=Zygotorulaspora mrakii TaxID=42260 RepID=A0A7H9B8Z5_ZYGMR|nr:uncharacterized protein HG535_0G03520 [Zygotorulaspora mrakii]QLG74469.1 hypothetical protein HG535_0G03520 [Zygotorulaspora mrakii]
MFRQSKKRVAARKNFGSLNNDSVDGTSQFILGSSTTEQERKLYESLYASKLSFYDLPPSGEITLDQFETWAIDRLKILLEIESGISRNKNVKEIEKIIKPQFDKLLPFNNDNFEDKKKDYYSHFILRLCFCRSKELREKFVRAETLLFKIRFGILTSYDQIKFVQSLNLPMLQFITEEEKNEISKQLYQTVSSQLQFQLNLTDENTRMQFFKQERFIKLPFENVIELVGNRQVFLKNGLAYLPQFQQLNLIANQFSNKLSDELLRTYKYLPHLNEDDRLLPILHHLSSGYTISDFQQQPDANANGNGEINANSVYTEEILSNFPLCTKNLFNALKENHHLRYTGRQQLSLFLKGIGLSADEALQFWQDAFTRDGHISVEKYDKEYKYNFRHNYGLQGSRINYKPWDCRTILSKPRPARGEYHGCPYRDWNADKLASELQSMNLSSGQITSVLDSCEKSEFTVACTKTFEFTHKDQDTFNGEVTDQSHIAHPNLYFEKSRQLQKKKENAAQQNQQIAIK